MPAKGSPQLFGEGWPLQMPASPGHHMTQQVAASYKQDPFLPQPECAGVSRGMGGTTEPFSPPILDPTKAAEGGAGGALGRQMPSVIFGLVCCQRGVLRQQPSIGVKASQTDTLLSQWERCLLHFPSRSILFSPRASTPAQQPLAWILAAGKPLAEQTAPAPLLLSRGVLRHSALPGAGHHH